MAGVNPGSPVYLSILLELPQGASLSGICNRLNLTLLPHFTHMLVDVLVRGASNTWTQLDMSYLPGYNATASPSAGPAVSYCPPLQMHFTPQPTTQVCLTFYISSWWGICDTGVQLVEYAPVANLAFNAASLTSSSITSLTLRGQSPSLLSQLPQTLAGSLCTVNLSQYQNNSSPVITNSVLTW